MNQRHQMFSATLEWPGLLKPRRLGPRRSRSRPSPQGVTTALFLCMFAAQSGQLVLTAVLTDAAREFEITTAAAGQIRSCAAIVAAAVAVALAAGMHRVRLRALLWAGIGLLATGSTLSLIAPSLSVLAAGQALTGAAATILTAAGVAAAAAWSDPANRGRAVAWALVGAPAAWVAAMPVIGLVGRTNWRIAFAVPVVAAAVAAVALRRAPTRPAQRTESGIRRVLADRRLRSWAISEVLSYAAWSGVLVYAGALLVESYGISLSTVGVALGLGAAAYIPGTFVAQRAAATRDARGLLGAVTVALAPAVVAFGSLRVGATATTIGFGVLCFLAGARTFLGSAVGLDLAADKHAAAMSLRAAAAQTGWILGGVAGGTALAYGGYTAVGLVLGALFAAAAVLHARALGALIQGASGHATRPQHHLPEAAPAPAR